MHTFKSKFFFITILLIIFGAALKAQAPYFQQKVDFKINVTLDDKNHLLKGLAEMSYTNNSSDTLKEIYLHYWTNAYVDNTTQFARQQLDAGKNRFYFAKPEERGRYVNYSVWQGQDSLATKYYKGNKDIILVTLTRNILPGETMKFSLPFQERIPAGFSRMGRSLNGYQVSQWYPKPAVYDNNGWHPIPYLDQGEFYSEFGDYEVSITLPANYIVAATGELSTTAEREFLLNKSKEELPATLNKKMKEAVIPSSAELKTLQYKAKNVHDFAWFADKGYLVRQSEVILKSGKEVKTAVFFLPESIDGWKNATKFVDRSILYMSEVLGEYLYPQATAVYGPLSAGGGMEYPMITIINTGNDPKSVDRVIQHELGHSWLYGMLASNERASPWMDEGINTYYENRYMEKYYAAKKSAFSENGLLSLGMRYQQIYNFQQPLGTSAEKFGRVNYGLDVYARTGYSFDLLENQFGRDEFDRRMQQYFSQWALKHSQPKNLEEIFRDQHKATDWFFNKSLNSKEIMDYNLVHVAKDDNKIKLSLRNKGDLNAPFPVCGYVADTLSWTEWHEGFTRDKEISLSNVTADKISVNLYPTTLDLRSTNNSRSIDNKKIVPIKLLMGPWFERPGNTNIYMLPMISYNQYDKFMLGIVVHNQGLPGRRLEYILAPSYAFGSKQLAGNANIQYYIPTDRLGNAHLKVGVNGRLYSMNYNEKYDYRERYAKAEPYLTYVFANPSNKNLTNSLTLKSTNLFFKQYDLKFDTIGTYLGKEATSSHRMVNSLIFEHKKVNKVSPFSFTSTLQNFNYTYFTGERRDRLRWLNEFTTDLYYSEKHKFSLRGWAGVMLYNSHKAEDDAGFTNYQEGVLSLFSNGNIDNLTTFDGMFLGRSAQSGLASAQILGNQNGGFKGAFNSALTSGISNTYLVSANFVVDMPISSTIFPLQAYLDVGYGPMAIAGATETKLLWEFGAMFDYFGIIKVHLPIAYHDELKYLYSQTRKGNFAARISFAMDLQKLNPIKWKKDLNKFTIL